MHIFTRLAFIGLIMLMLIAGMGTVYAQAQEDDFSAETVVPKRDIVALSVLYPGLGQMTRGEKGKGFAIFLGETLSLLTFINSHENYSTKVIAYTRDLDEFKELSSQSMKTYEHADALYKSLSKKSKQLDDLHNTRNLAVGAAVGLYIYNIVDVLFLGENVTRSNKVENDQNRIYFQTAMIGNNYGILLSKSF